MCGILFYLKKNKKNISRNEKKLLIESSKLLYHRGPDYKKYLILNNQFIFHSRLSIQDLSSKSNQPMIKKQQKKLNYLIYNGEIYNFKKLKNKINNKQSLKTTGDTEVLFQTFLNYKDKKKFLENLQGMFSFMIINDDEVFFARDRYGQKPLYYYNDNKIIVFSSEIKPILNIINKSKLNKEEVKKYVTQNLYFGSRETFYQNINQVKSSEFGIIKNNNIYLNKYYYQKIPEVRKDTKLNNFFKNFTKNILDHTISDKKIAISLSSGIDSQSIAHVLFSNKKLNYDIMSYTIDFEGSNFEFEESKKFIKSYNQNIKKVLITEKFVVNNFEKYFFKNEGPIGGLMQLGMFRLCEFVKKDGYDVLLAGFGLDECFGSYSDIRKKIKDKIDDSFNLIDSTKINNQKYLKFSSKSQSNKLFNNYFFKSKIPRTTHFVDRLSMASSIELRLPFLDHLFVQKCLNFKIDLNKKDKYLIRSYLNVHSKHKKNWFEGKIHVPHPQNKWLKSGILSDWTEEIIRDNFLYKNLDFLNKNEIINDWKKFKSQRNTSGYFFWQLINVYYLLKFSKTKRKKFFNYV